MFNNNNGYSLADIAAATGNGGYGNGFGGDGSWWLLVLFLFAFAGNGGWGNGFFGGGMPAAAAATAPYIANAVTQSDVQRGFDQSAIISGINGINSTLSNGFANAEVSRCNAQTNLLQTLNANQAGLTNQLNTIAMAQQNCCCENRAAVADLKYTVATENCADRAAVSDGIRDVIASNTANTQAILDKLCAMEIDGLKERNADLLARNNALEFASSQAAQDGFIQSAINNAVSQLQPTPRPAYIVSNPYYSGNYGMGGCGCSYNY